MIYSATYPDNSGVSRTREFIASDEAEVRRIMRRSGISTKEATIIEVAQQHSNSFQEDFDRHNLGCFVHSHRPLVYSL